MKSLLALIALVVMLTFAGSAHALSGSSASGSAAQTQYAPESGGASIGSKQASGSLPTTGLDVLPIVALGFVLLGAGSLMYRTAWQRLP